jgi:propionate catabolism operon transcriptional regulator
VLQEREVLRIGAIEPTRIDIRVIAATHRNLNQQIVSGEFRGDLYYRLNILRLSLPPLRERIEDLPELARHVLRRVGERVRPGASTEALMEEFLLGGRHYAWPGNVRELENFVERIATYHPGDGEGSPREWLRELIPEMFSVSTKSSEPLLAGHRVETELQMIERVLAECGGDKSLAATRLGIGRTTLWRKLSRGQARRR